MATRYNVDPGRGPVMDVPWRHYRVFLAAAALGCGATGAVLAAGGVAGSRAALFGAAGFLVLALVGAVLNEVTPRGGKWTLFALLVLSALGSVAFVGAATPGWGALAPALAAASWAVGAAAYFGFVAWGSASSPPSSSSTSRSMRAPKEGNQPS